MVQLGTLAMALLSVVLTSLCLIAAFAMFSAAIYMGALTNVQDSARHCLHSEYRGDQRALGKHVALLGGPKKVCKLYKEYMQLGNGAFLGMFEQEVKFAKLRLRSEHAANLEKQSSPRSD